MEFEKLVKERYAVKQFDGKKIPKDKIDKLKEIVRMAPSSFNLQTWKIKVVEDEETKMKLQAVSWNQPQVGTCSHLFVFCANMDVKGNLKLLLEQMRKSDAPAQSMKGFEDMISGFLKNMAGEKRLSWAQRQVYLAGENALLGAKALGFDSCPMEGFDPVKYAEILKLPKNLVATLVIPVGYATDKVQPKVRLENKDIFF